jgi:hypothetical protein
LALVAPVEQAAVGAPMAAILLLAQSRLLVAVAVAGEQLITQEAVVAAVVVGPDKMRSEDLAQQDKDLAVADQMFSLKIAVAVAVVKVSRETMLKVSLLLQATRLAMAATALPLHPLAGLMP